MSSTQQLLLGEGAGGAAPVYIEDVFSTYLYTGNGSTQTITNGIDLSTKGGLVWIKARSGTYSTGYHVLNDTVRGAQKALFTNTAGAEFDNANVLTAFTSTGFSVGTSTDVNGGTTNMVSWTFREQPKFFDIVTYTGNGAADRNITHNLGSVPGMIVIKKTSGTGDWVTAASLSSTVYAIGGGGSGSGYEFALNKTDIYYDNPLKSTIATDTTVNVPKVYYNDATVCNASGATYVMYLFASNAGGFGLTGTDNVISCGSFTADGSGNATVNLGYEPQYLLWKRTDAAQNWFVADTMRGFSFSDDQILRPNLANAEFSASYGQPTATGFSLENQSAGGAFIYIAIRRGPMKVPTSGTSVFSPIANSASTGTVNTTGFPVDMGIVRWRSSADSNFLRSRLQGVSSTTTESGAFLKTNATDAESTAGGITRLWNNTGFQTTSGFSGLDTVYWNFGRAPGFFDEVCYTGDGSTTRQVTHNLGTTPQLIIIKNRGAADSWEVRYPSVANTKDLLLNFAIAESSLPFTPADTSTTFTASTQGSAATNDNANTYVAYLFATVAGVSKVGSYTGTAAAQTINCGFTSGARWVMIKRTDSGSSSWYVWDSARGITSGNDPYLRLNLTSAEVTTNDFVNTDSTGFQLTSNATSDLNGSGGTFLFWAIA